MDAKERAGKIAERMWSVRFITPKTVSVIKDFITAQIEEACAEAFKSGCNSHLATCAEQFNEGFAACRERARDIAGKIDSPIWSAKTKQVAEVIGVMIAQKISALGPGE